MPDSVVDALAVVSFLELRHQAFALNLSYQSVVEIALEMIADLSEVFSILYRDQQQKTVLVAFFRSDSPTASHVPVNIRKCPDRQWYRP